MVITLDREAIRLTQPQFTALQQQLQTLNDMLYNRWRNVPHSAITRIPDAVAAAVGECVTDQETVSLVRQQVAVAVANREAINLYVKG
jgi:hypothetical protein